MNLTILMIFAILNNFVGQIQNYDYLIAGVPLP